MKMERNYYDLSPAQDVPYLQTKYTIFKRVINILTSITIDKDVDFDLMKKAYNLVVERNDCLRIKFLKRQGRLMQYFRTIEEIKPLDKIPFHSFETEGQQRNFIEKYRKSAIKYKKGIVIEPHFIKTFDNKNMILIKVCHLVLDTYGVSFFYKDLLAVYEALKNGTDLPAQPASYEEIVKKDIEKGRNESLYEKHYDFFSNLFEDNPEPYYAGVAGPELPSIQKLRAKNRRGCAMSILWNFTQDYRHTINSDIVNRVYEYCKATQTSPADFFMYTVSLTASRLNNNAKNILPLNLCHNRISQNEKNCGGTKVQSLATYTKFNYKESFEENLKLFKSNQTKLYMHLGFPDRDFETLIHSKYRSSLLETYYNMSFSFVPFELPDGIHFDMYSNGNGALAAYVILLLDVKTNEIRMAYDVQVNSITEEHVDRFHQMYLDVINQVLDNPQIQIKDVSIDIPEVEE